MSDPKTVAFHTFGCKVNQYETEELREQLKFGGFKVVPMDQAADVYILNSCTVTADADSSCRQMVRKILREQPTSRVVVTGCYAERAPDELRDMSDRVEVFGNREKPLIATTLGVPTACIEAAAKQGVTALADRTRAYIKVQDGCDAHCTYCIIPSVRPNLICREPELVLREAQNLITRGFREIVLTGVRLGRYEYKSSQPAGNDARKWDFTQLLEALLALPGEFRIRLSSIEMTEIPDRVIELAATHPKMCPFFHIPLQSGDDEILKRMGRWYTVGDYRARIQQIKQRIPDVALSADVICGFPGEGEEQFQNTLNLLEEEGFSRVHAFRYSVRPGTPAERLSNPVDGSVKAERTRRLSRLDRTLRERFATRFIGKPLKILPEFENEGYSEHYIRVKALGSPIGTGEMASMTGTSVDGILLYGTLVPVAKGG
jgi:threonylcarbamoyladenosine tRNA methylthiotransferase MtaB